MGDLNVNADLLVEQTGGGTRRLHEDDFDAVKHGAATEATVAQLLAELAEKLEPGDLAGLATWAKQDALLAALGPLALDATVGDLVAAVAGAEAARDADATSAQARLDQLASEAKLEQVWALLDAEDFASQATLEQLRALVAGEDFAQEATLATRATEASLAALLTAVDGLEALTTTIRDEQQRRTDPLAAGANIVGFVSPSVSKKVGEGKFYVAGGLQSVALNNRALFRFVNPSGSGKTAYIVKMTFYSTQSSRVFYNEDGALPAAGSVLTPRNLVLAMPDSSAMTLNRVSSTASVTNGTTYDNESRVTSATPLELEFPPLVASPGKSLTVFTEALTAPGEFTANVYYYEE